LSKQTNNIVANKICVVSKIGLGTGIFGKMAVKGLKQWQPKTFYCNDIVFLMMTVYVVVD